VGYKLLALDVDGTLLRRDGTIHADDRAAIGRLHASGVPVTIATGRLYSGTHHVAREVGIKGPIACVDGSQIVDLGDDTPLYYRAITGDDAAVLRDVLVSNRAASFVFSQDTIVHDADGEPYVGYVRTWSPRVDVVERVTDHHCWTHEHGIVALVALGRADDIRAAVREIEARIPHAAHVITFPVMRVEMFAMVVRANGPTKGTAVEWLARHYGCEVDDVVVVGDWINDVPMFEVAGRSFAMGQAPSHVKETATDELEADCYAGGGIAEAIARAWGI
jgi:hypothetical protein